MSSLPSRERLLIVDDEPQILHLVERLLVEQGYECFTATGTADARRLLEETMVELVLSDVSMPGESGLDFTREVLATYPDTAVVMVTGLDDRRYADAAIELGAYGYVLKPFRPNELIVNVRNALRRRALELESRDLREELEQTVLERTGELRDTIARLESSDAELRRLREETIRRLSSAAEFRNQETGEHIIRMSLYCSLLAQLARLGAERAAEIRGLSDDEIPLEGRIASIADVFDALTSARVYRPAYEPEEAQAMMAAGRGAQFDADLLDLFLDSFDDVVAIRRSTHASSEHQSLAVDSCFTL